MISKRQLIKLASLGSLLAPFGLRARQTPPSTARTASYPQTVNVGICGLGTVGGGTFNVLKRNAETISGHCGSRLQVMEVASRSFNPSCSLEGVPVAGHILDIARNPQIDILVETIGGYDAAKILILEAIRQGKHVVTANKALIAEHGDEIFAAARKHQVIVAYEAAVAGGIPIIRCLREGLAANRIQQVAGIINGTGNFIVTRMAEEQCSFSEALSEAQSLGYAEADPAFDVKGIDACHKLTIMAAIAFGIPLQFRRAYTEGLESVDPVDIQRAVELGLVLKHLGIARKTNRGVELRVHPTLIPVSSSLASVDGVMNGIQVKGDAVGDSFYQGAGAGSEATASSVVADLMDISRMIQRPELAVAPFGFQTDRLDTSVPVIPISEVECGHYIRVQSRKGNSVVKSRVLEILEAQQVPIRETLQISKREMVVLTEVAREKKLLGAMSLMNKLFGIDDLVIRIRVEEQV